MTQFEQEIIKLLGLEKDNVISLQINIEVDRLPEVIIHRYVYDEEITNTKDYDIN
jgi:hypothetical protein